MSQLSIWLIGTVAIFAAETASNVVQTKNGTASAVVPKSWIQVISDKENQNRDRHGSEPLKLTKELNDAAQAWANKMATECRMQHSQSRDRQWNGAGTGESLFAASGADEKEKAANQAADSWYSEVKNYPFPGGYRGNDMALFMKIGHFTQTVWKSTKFVGYGHAYNPNCRSMTRYITARYSPPGNMGGEYQENVLPPKK